MQEEGHLNEEVDKISQAIKAKSRAIIALGKEFFYRQLQLPIEEAYKLGAEVGERRITISRISYRALCRTERQAGPQDLLKCPIDMLNHKLSARKFNENDKDPQYQRENYFQIGLELEL